MQGYIRKRGKGSWEVTVSLGRDPSTGRRRRRFLIVRGTKRDAERVLAEALHQRDTGIDVSPGKLTVADYLRPWLRDYAGHNVAPSTLARYRSIVEQHLIPTIGSLKLSELRPAHIQAAYGVFLRPGSRRDGSRLGLSARTVLHHHRLLHEALDHAVRLQLIARNPADAVAPPRPATTEMRVLDEEQVTQLLAAAAETPYYAFVYVALATGARLGELLALRWEDIDLRTGTTSIIRTVKRVTGRGLTFGTPKTHRSRRPVALSAETGEVFQEHRRRQLEHRLGWVVPIRTRGLCSPALRVSPWTMRTCGGPSPGS